MKSRYIPVLSTMHQVRTNTVYPPAVLFDQYLVTLGDGCSSRNWSLIEYMRHAAKLIKDNKKLRPEFGKKELYLDSGGYQMIVKKISKPRISEYIDCYHHVMYTYKDDIDKIFGLDVIHPNIKDNTELYNLNKLSQVRSLEMLNKFPQLKDKQLYIFQLKNQRYLDIWTNLFNELEIDKTYSRYSIGGLVGFKMRAKVDFTIFVPQFMLLMALFRSKNYKPTQVHMLGQSSPTALIMADILEKYFDVQITLDSSQCIRFSPIKAKLPIMQKMDDKYIWVKTIQELMPFVDEANAVSINKNGRLAESLTFMRLMSEDILYTMEASDEANTIMAKDLLNMPYEQFKENYELFNIGKTLQSLWLNISIIREMMPLIDDFNKMKTYYIEKVLSQFKAEY